MIGFDIKATGTGGYKRSSGAWTEGSMIALQALVSLPKVNLPGTGGNNRKILAGIEAGFGKIKDALLDDVCGNGRDFTLSMTGDIKFTYKFDYSKSLDQVKKEFLHNIAKANDGEIGDQVMLHICRAIQEFRLHTLTTKGALHLTVDVDL